MRELLEQFTEANATTHGSWVVDTILHPFLLNGAARGYAFREVEDRDSGGSKDMKSKTIT